MIETIHGHTRLIADGSIRYGPSLVFLPDRGLPDSAKHLHRTVMTYRNPDEISVGSLKEAGLGEVSRDIRKLVDAGYAIRVVDRDRHGRIIGSHYMFLGFKMQHFGRSIGQPRITPRQQAILKHATDRCVTVREVADELTEDTESVRTAMKRLVDRGLLTRVDFRHYTRAS